MNEPVSGNAIMVIKPYLWNGMWVFDDEAVGLRREPFVAGMDAIIEHAVTEIPNAAQGFLAVFSAGPFPGAQIVLELLRPQGTGHVYRWAEHNMEGWLCPALLKYFQEPPKTLHIQLRPTTA